VLWKVTPAGTATQLAGGIYYNSGLDVAPSGDVFAVTSSTGVLRITPAGQVSVYASGLSKANDVAVSPITGEVYVMDWDAGAIFRANPNGTVTTTINVCCLGPSQIGAGRDGNIYWVGFGDRYTPGHERDMHMLRITPAGEVTLFARHLPIDPLAVTGSPDSTDLYFSSSRGVYRVFEAKTIFLPLILKGSGPVSGRLGHRCQRARPSAGRCSG
jgi:sugar lactone lactonase YvrE